MKVKAKWIWKKLGNYSGYNHTIIAKKSFTLGPLDCAIIRITADSFYRLFINGQWVNDGPCRSWPERFQYDAIDVTGYLHEGPNEIKIIARCYGVGDFHGVRIRPGLLVQLDAQLRSGKTQTIASDSTWQVANAVAWRRNTPKVSIQMEPAEFYDATVADYCSFSKARALFSAEKGPWKNLNPRDVALLTKRPLAPKSFLSAKIVKAQGLDFCIPATRLCHPGLIEANRYINAPLGLATVVNAKKRTTLTILSEFVRDPNLKLAIDGKTSSTGRFTLSKGSHLLLAFTKNALNHDKEFSIRFLDADDITLQNPARPEHENPWLFLKFNEYAFAHNDLNWQWFLDENPDARNKIQEFDKLTDGLLRTVKNKESLLNNLKKRIRLIPSAEMFLTDAYWQFRHRTVLGDAANLVIDPAACTDDSNEVTVVEPAPSGDVELAYDLGEQSCGYYSFELAADAGVTVDINSVEYIAPDGRIQHTVENRNGMRYITKDGANAFTSLKRRAGRFIFITLRNQTTPVVIRSIRLIESTYPAEHVASFDSGDDRLNRVWETCARTLKLCSEDTFTDCPLYEQTLWVGDARNEALFAYSAFGATDIARRCIKLAAQSLARFPIVGCQVPSSWDCLLPAWSFLWGISVWDYYWYTADKEFLAKIFPAVIRNLQGAEKFIAPPGLFSAPFWNFFDWTPIDQDRKTVLHNSMLLVGAINAALDCAKALGDKSHTPWLKKFRASLVRAINTCWDKNKNSYPDSIHDDGTPSPSTCQHTSFLSILYGIIESKNLPHALKNITAPPNQMVRVGSPFAILYLYETLEKLGLEDKIIASIYDSYLPMLDAGATTVWESFPSGTLARDAFPTRSHCHGWSAAPLYFLPRIILGLKQTAPGGASYTLSPRLSNLTHASGRVATINGHIETSWNLSGKNLDIKYSAPPGIKIKFSPNNTHKSLQITLNDKRITPK